MIDVAFSFNHNAYHINNIKMNNCCMLFSKGCRHIRVTKVINTKTKKGRSVTATLVGSFMFILLDCLAWPLWLSAAKTPFT